MIRKLSLALLASTGLVPAMAFAQTLPTGGEVAAGQATITPTGPGGMQIVQGTDRAIINWQSFSVGEGGHVDFVQPGAQAALLNRVTGDTTSTIAGRISANGRIFLVNPNGILITKTGSVNAAGFTASTLDIADKAFMAGSNELTITAPRVTQPIRYAQGGFAGLLSGRETNDLVVAKVRTLNGGGGQALDLDGAGFLQVKVPEAGISVAGRITANDIVLTTGTARDAARGVVNISGALDASSVSAKGGTITLTGNAVNLTGATINASGASGGGRIRVGGEYQGGDGLARAAQLAVDGTSTIKADATASGDGGNIVLWSDDKTSFAGRISAKGINGGAGGDAEVSGKALLSYTGHADLTGSRFGTLLLDPYNVTISTGTDSNQSGFTATGNDSVINATTLQTALASANVTVSTGSGGSQAGDIFVDAPIAWSSGALLTLNAAGQIFLNQNIDVNGGGQLALNFATTNPLTGGLVYGVGAKVSFADGQAGQSLNLNGNGYTLLRSMADIDGIDGTSAVDGSAITSTGSASGRYALAKDLSASGVTYTRALILVFGGALEGLGHAVDGLTILQSSGSSSGLIGQVPTNTPVVIRGIALTNVAISSTIANTGVLVGDYRGGGLISQTSTTGTVKGKVQVGGLIGFQGPGQIALSYSTASVDNSFGGGSNSNVGGLIGTLTTGGKLDQSYATGSVVVNDFDPGLTFVGGGLVGTLSGNGTAITQSYATGAVYGDGNAYLGGLLGRFTGSGALSLTQVYSSGAVSGGQPGGLVGNRNASATNVTVTSSYWDTQTSGQAISAEGTGQTTAQLQSGTLPGGFDPAAWVAAPGFYPVLAGAARSGGSGSTPTMQVITGSGLLSNGSGASGASIGLYYNGSLLSGNTVTTDSTGAYSALVPTATLSGTFAIGQTITLSGASAVSGLAYGDNYTTGGDGNVSGLVVRSGSQAITTGLGSTTALGTALNTTFGSDLTAINQALVATPVALTARNVGGFAIDSAQAARAYTLTALGPLSINAGVTAQDAAKLTSAGAITIGTGGSVTSAAPGDAIVVAAASTFTNTGGSNALTASNGRWLVYQGTGTGGVRGGLAGGNFYNDSFDFTAGTFASAPASGNRFVYAAQPTLTVTANAASAAYTGSAQSGTYAVSNLINGDTAGNALSGSATGLTTSSKDVGSYTLTPGGLVSSLGYAINYVGGTYSITPATLTYLATTASRSYGDNNPGFAGSVTGFLGSDTQANSTTGTLAFASAATGTSNVGSYAINGSGLSATNYTFVQSAGNATALTVTPRSLTITADAKSRVYGDTNPGLTYTIGGQGLITGDSLSGSLFTLADTTSNVGSYAITQGTLAANSNYVVTGYTGANLTVGQRSITVAADAKSRVYGDTNPALTYSVGGQGLITGDGLSGSLATSADAASNVGSYAITQGTLAANSNYVVTGYTGANLTIGQRSITIAADAKSRVYGDTNPALTYSVGGQGLIVGDALSGGLATSADAASNVGSYAITQGTLAANSNYVVTGYTGANLTIGQRSITIAANAKSRVYGDTNPALTYSVGGQGLVNGDALSGSLATLADVTSNVGSYAITQGTLGASGNYVMTGYTGADLTVGQRSLIIAADAKSRVYGDANPTLTYTVGGQGLVNGDALSGSLATLADVTSNVGSYAITQGTLGASGNYVVTGYTGANLTIGQRSITIAADAKSRVYGDTNPALTYSVGGQGLITGDSLSGSLATSADATSNVGNYAITQGTLGAGGNYVVTGYTGADLTIGQRSITIAADAQNRVYGDINPTLTYSVGGQGLIIGDSLSGSLTTPANASSNVGSYAITQGTLAANSNYVVTGYTGANLTIGQRSITIAADAKSRVYGDTNPALTYSVGGQGLIVGDALSGSLATSANATSNVGSYAITQGTLGAGGNYVVTDYTGANLTIGQRSLTIAADAKSRVYGDANPALTYSVGGQGLVNGDALSGSLATLADATSNVGSYAITQGTLGAGGNYAVTGYTGANLTIGQRSLTIAADAKSRVYGDANPALTYTVGGQGLVNGDALSGSLATLADATSNVGSYAITQGTLGAGGNYAVTDYTGANLTIGQRSLTIAADAKSRVYGDANPALTYTVGGQGLVNGDALSGSLATLADATSNVGSYAITQGTLGAGGNYALTFMPSSLIVNSFVESTPLSTAGTQQRDSFVRVEMPTASTSNLTASTTGNTATINEDGPSNDQSCSKNAHCNN